jgi:simple sugar transport system ATP-binding protein
MALLAQLTDITKAFGRVSALDGADLQVPEGMVSGVLGENGAGKTTLLNILGGMLSPDSGSVEVGGHPVSLRRPRDAWKVGVGMVHQHFTLVPDLTVLENLALGRRTSAWGLGLGYEALREEVAGLVGRTGLDVSLDDPVRTLEVGERQRVEILKALLKKPRILILDEPTAVLTPGEVDSLFCLLRSLAEEGSGVVLVAHKLDEVLDVADRVTVLRDGRTVLSASRGEVDAPMLIRAMVGRERVDAAAVGHGADRSRRTPVLDPSPPVAHLEEVRVRGSRGEDALRGVSMEVRRREIVGVVGVEGNGQRELALVMAGRLKPSEGSVHLPSGVGFIPQDRTLEGLVGSFDLTENVALALHRDEAFRSGPFLRWRALKERTAELVGRFGVRARGVGTLAGTLSGGNQQRLVVARELHAAKDLLVAENPTRGLDVAAASFVHEELSFLRRIPEGPGIVLISSDLDEVLSLSDRVMVMVRGALVDVPHTQRSRQFVGALMLSGVHA